MSLIDEFMTPCVLMEKTRKPDGEGGFTVSWTEGAPIAAAVVHDVSLQTRAAEQQGLTSTYTVTTGKTAKLEYHDVFMRLSDRKIFRVTSDGDDIQSPERASFSVSVVTAEAWRLTS